MLALPALLLKDSRDGSAAEHGAPFFQQMRAVLGAVRASPTVMFTIIGFVLAHLVFVGIYFTQLWLVRERGFDAAGIARQIGAIGLAFGVLGSVVGGVLSDRLAHYIKGGHAGFMALLVLLCGPLMLAYRFAEPGSILFYTGMCAGFFLPLALYGPALALIQGLTPVQMRSTVTGFTMLVLNVFAIAIGNAAAGAVSDPDCGRLDTPVDHRADGHRPDRHRRRSSSRSPHGARASRQRRAASLRTNHCV